MDTELKSFVVAQLPIVIAFLAVASINLKESGRPLMSQRMRTVLWATHWFMFLVWFVVLGLGLFSTYVGVSDRFAWNYFLVGFLLKSLLYGTKGKIISGGA